MTEIFIKPQLLIKECNKDFIYRATYTTNRKSKLDPTKKKN